MSTKNIETTLTIFKILRLCLSLSVNEMAELCNVSAVYYGQLERGIKTNPSRAVVASIAKACNMKPETIEFFITKQQDERLDYQTTLLESLERLALSIQQRDLAQKSTDSYNENI